MQNKDIETCISDLKRVFAGEFGFQPKLLALVVTGFALLGTSAVAANVDLAMRNLSVTRPSEAGARTFVACSFDIYNYGPSLTSGALLVEYYLSSDTTFGNGDDRKIGDTGFSGISIAAGGTWSVSLSSTGLGFMVDEWTSTLVASGNYYVYARVSCSTATETDPSDNYGRTSSTFSYAPIATVDLAMRNLSVTRPVDPGARTFLACSYDIYNYGPALSSGSLLVEYYLSSDTTFGNSDDRKIGD